MMNIQLNPDHVLMPSFGPDDARECLGRNHPKNRALSPSRVDFYAKIMQSGRWYLTHQGLAFDDKGRMVDGHHRCEAVVISGVVIPIYVTFGLTTDAILVIDTQMGRSNSCRVTMASDFTISEKTGAFIKLAVTSGNTNEKFDQHDLWFYYSGMQDGVRFVEQRLHRSEKSPVKAAVLRAYYADGVDRTRLGEFCDCLSSCEISGPEDRAASMLLAWSKKRDGQLTHKIRQAYYLLTQKALSYFLKQTCPKSLKASKEDLFPLPASLIPSV